jgi:hypothetical protein
MREFVRGIIHVHSDFSEDGFHSVADLGDFARETGFSFVGLTDHAEDLSPRDMANFRQECEKHSGDSCVLIPGLEFRCSGDVHMLGLGINDGIHDDDPVKVATEIRRRGGLAVLAHPGRNGYQCPAELYPVLNGIEIWNAGYDGRFVLPLANLRLLQEARTANHNILGFGGEDLHIWDRPPRVVVNLRRKEVGRLDIGMVLHGLQMGRFSVHGRYLSFDAMTGPDWLGGIPLRVFRKIYEISRGFRNAVFGDS